MAQRALVLKVAGLTILYVATAKVGIELSVAQGVITPVWIPTGLSLAALLLFGYRLWPGVALGAFIANGTSDLPLLLAAGIAVGNTLEAVVGTYLLRRVGFHNSLERVRDVIALVALGALASTAVAATNGVGVLWLGGEIESVGYEWLLWWFGDAVGVILVAPVLLTWLTPRLPAPTGNLIEAVLLATSLIAASCIVFLGGNWKYPYLLFPLLVWAAIRFKQRGAAIAVFLVGAIGTLGTVEGAVPIGGATATQSVQILQALIAVVGVAVYIMAATLAELDAAQQRERAYAGRLRELDQIKNTFMSAVSHDLRSPLATISGLAEVLMRRLDGLDRDVVMESLGRIEANAHRSTDVLVNLLDVDRVSRGAVEPVRKETDLGDLIARVTLGLDPEERRDIELLRQHVSVSVDEGLVERMVANLLGNAVRHTPTGTPVSVRVLEEDGGVVLCVDDRGPGVPDDLKETIFEPFERGSVDSAVGSGVGLYLVASFAELHGGRAWVQDAVDGGASFRVFFPGTLRNGVPPSPPVSPPG